MPKNAGALSTQGRFEQAFDRLPERLLFFCKRPLQHKCS